MNKFKETLNGLKIVLLSLSLLISFKFIIGYITNTQVLIADAFHSLSDMIVLIVVYIGIIFSLKKPDENFKYGYYKAESIAALFISLFVIFVGIDIIFQGIFENEKKITNPLLALLAAIISAGVSYFISKYEEKISKELNLHSLEATSEEAMGDFLTSIGTAIAIISNMYGIPYIEKMILILFGVIIAKTGIKSTITAIHNLMDISPKELEEKIKKDINKEFKLKDLKLRVSGPFVFGEITIVIDNKLSLEEAHNKVSNLEKKLYKKYPQLQNITIHFEPEEKNEKIIMIPLNEKNNISDHFLNSDNFAYYSINKRKEIKLKEIKENKIRHLERGKGRELNNYLEKVDYIIVKNIGKSAYNLAKGKNIIILKSKYNNIKENLKNIDSLEEVEENELEDGKTL